MPPPPTPAAPAAHATPATRVTYDYVTRTIAGTLGNPGRGYYALLGSAVTLLAIGIVCLLYLCATAWGPPGTRCRRTGPGSSSASCSGWGSRPPGRPSWRSG